MKPQLTFVFALFCLSLTAQVKFKVALLPDNSSYQVSLRPDISWSLPLNTVPSAQVTVRVPTGGFPTPVPVTSLAGNWGFVGKVVSPPENPGFDYLIFGLQGVTTAITFQSGTEVALFNFVNNGSCTGVLELINHDTDPFMPPNSQSVNIGNQISVVGAGIGVNAYTGNYGAYAANCLPLPNNCGIEVYDVKLKNPSACGVADGSIEIVASATGLPPLQYSINGGVSWQSSPIFPNLASGNTFEIIVRDILPICIVEVGDFQLQGPLSAVITGYSLVDPDCDQSNGSITINAYSENGGILQYSLNSGGPWQGSNTFTGLPAGTYSVYIRNVTSNCSGPAGVYTLQDCPVEPCLIFYELEHLGNGQYQVNLHSDTTWSFPNNITSSLQVTIKVPTGGFSVSNLTSQVTNVTFGLGSVYVAPAENPGFDYISFTLTSNGTQGIPYIKNTTIPLFTFTNSGICTGDSLYLMTNDDPFYPPNAANANVGQQLTVSGYGGADVPVCFNGKSSAECHIPVPPVEPCLITYELEHLGNGQYQVNLQSDTTWTFPNNITSSLQVTVKAPTGGFTAGNLTSQVANVTFAQGSVYVAPAEEPGYDYISFTLTSNGTQGIPYVKGSSIPLFTFENTGTCTGDSIFLMTSDDPFYPPNAANANVGQQLTVSGYGGADVPVCIGGTGAAACSTLPPPVPVCPVTYEIEKLAGGEFQVSMISDTTWVFPNNITSSMQFTVKVPTGGFVASNLTSQIGGVTFSQASTYVAPSEDPGYDYISFILGSPGTQSIPYQKGVKTPLFTFENSGTCQGGQVVLMDNDTDPFYPPNSQNANVGQQLTVSGYGGADAPVCISNLPAEDCTNDPCALLSPGFFAENTCEGISLDFSNTTTSIEPIASWNWDFGDNSAPSNLESPSHSFSISGNFEVSLTVTTESGCQASFSEFVTVFPSPGEAPFDFYAICNGDTIQLLAPGVATAVWSPATGLSDPNVSNPFAFPAATTVYTLTVTNDFGCVRSEQVTVEVANKPILNSVVISDQSDCGLQDGKITINATGTGDLQYSIDNGSTWQNTATYTGLAAGVYIVLVRNATGSCPIAYNGNPVTISAPQPPVLNGISFTQPTGCDANGAILITASGGTPPLLYSINGGLNFQTDNQFLNLAPGNYQVVVANADTTCFISPVTPVTLLSTQPPVVLTPVADFSLCLGTDEAVSIQVNQPLISYNIVTQGTYANAFINGNTLSFVVSGVTVGNQSFSVEMTTALGCTVTENFILTTIANPVASFNAPSSFCANGEVALSFNGLASPQAVLVWSLDGGSIVTASQQTPSAPDSANMLVNWATPGLKMVVLTVTDQGCVATGTGEINITTFDPGLALTVTDATCGENNGAIQLSTSGGGTYTYIWNNGLGSQNLSGLSGGGYQVTVTEVGTGCSATASTTVNATPGLSIVSLTESQATDCSGNTSDGSLHVEINGGTGNLTYALYQVGNLNVPINQFTTSQHAATFSGLGVGAYQIEVVDAIGCSVLATTTVTSGTGSLGANTSLSNATCGQNNGSFSITLHGGQSPFQYDLFKNNSLIANDIQMSDSTLSLGNLEAAAYVLLFTDANGCLVPVVVTIQNSEIFINSTTTLASGCGNADGSICIEASGGSGPYTLSASQGTAPVDSFDSTACVTGLTDGTVEIVITDVHGCTKTLTFDMGQIVLPELTLDSLTVTGITCPGSFGSIASNTSHQYQIFDSNNSLVGLTPWTAALAGTYKVVHSISNCTAEVFVTITGIADWDVTVTNQAATCAGDDGLITLSVSGANGGYVYQWSNGDSLSIAENLSASLLYSVTISDSLGCSMELSDLFVDLDCIQPCDDIFYLDTFNVTLQPGLTEICLPTNLPIISNFDLVLDGNTYTAQVSGCVDSAHFYDYGMLLNLGSPPYFLESWSINGTTVDNFLFNDFYQLVDMMNDADPLGNWVLDTLENSIVGGQSGTGYASLAITHLASNTTLTLPLATVSVAHPSIFVTETPLTHIFVAIDPLWGCADTLYINLVEESQPVLPDIDTIFVQLPVGGDTILCIPTDELPGTLELMSNACVSATDPAQVNFLGNECVEIVGMEVGEMQACIILCDDLGVCDTTIVIIEVLETNRELEIYTGFSPNEDGINDFFKIKNIEYYPDNELVIFNRWGNKVYEVKTYSNENPWQGQYGDKILPDGTYFYILDVVIDGKKMKFSGYVELRR